MAIERKCVLRCLMVLALLAVLAFVVPSHASQDMCMGAFGGVVEKPQPVAFIPENVELKGLRLEWDRLPLEITSEKDPRFKQGLVNLLKMLTDTVFTSASRKTTLEKGELRLAKALDDGRSLEFEYTGDKRGKDTVFRLTKIVFVKPNGQEMALDKSPVSDDGVFLNKMNVVLMEKKVAREEGEAIQIQPLDKSEIDGWIKDNESLKEILHLGKSGGNLISSLQEALPRLVESDRLKVGAMVDNVSVVKIPTVIRGPLLSRLLDWIDRVPHLSREEMRTSLGKNSVRGLVWKARVRSNFRFMVNVAKKQLFKYMLFGAMFVGYAHYDSIMDRAQFGQQADAPVTRIERVIHSAPLSTEEALMMNDVVRGMGGNLSRDWTTATEIQNRISESRGPRNAEADFARFETLMSQLIAKESSMAGETTVWVGDVDLKRIQQLSGSASVRESIRARVDSGYALAHFKNQEKILLTAIRHDGKADHMPLVSTILIEKASSPALYEQLLQGLRFAHVQ